MCAVGQQLGGGSMGMEDWGKVQGARSFVASGSLQIGYGCEQDKMRACRSQCGNWVRDHVACMMLQCPRA